MKSKGIAMSIKSLIVILTLCSMTLSTWLNPAYGATTPIKYW